MLTPGLQTLIQSNLLKKTDIINILSMRKISYTAPGLSGIHLSYFLPVFPLALTVSNLKTY